MVRSLTNVEAIIVSKVTSIGMTSEEDDTQWEEIEITVQYRKDGKTISVESLSFLGFKQLIMEADRKEIAVKYLEKSEEPEKEDLNLDVISMARELIKVERRQIDPAFV